VLGGLIGSKAWLGLPLKGERFMVECAFVQWENKKKTRILVSCALFRQRFVWKNSDVMRFGMVHEQLARFGSFCFY
jgi:hypothetical protein